MLYIPKIIAGLLAIGGAWWGFLCLLAWVGWNPPSGIIMFGPGYFVTMGYAWRAVATPALWLRRGLWIASFFVQGGWLFYYLLHIEGGVVRDYFNVLTYWWFFATIGSAVALAVERQEKPIGPTL
jgi:hypothetical protein